MVETTKIGGSFYNLTRSVRVTIRNSVRKGLIFIDGSGAAPGGPLIQIPFNLLGLIIDVDLTILADYYPSLFLNRDMITNVLHINSQESS